MEIPIPKVWLITGSSRGLGRALAEAVLAAGDKLVATARNPEQLADLVERHGDQVRTVALDVTNEQAAAHAVGLATETFGRLDVLANNAGTATSAQSKIQASTNFVRRLRRISLALSTSSRPRSLSCGSKGQVISFSSRRSEAELGR